MKPLESLIQQLENQISNASISNLSVSNSSVGWQIEHSLLTIKLITEQLKKSDPNQYKWTFNIGRILILTMQKIPRGKAQAPKIVVPKEGITTDSLKATVRQAKESIQVYKYFTQESLFRASVFWKIKCATNDLFSANTHEASSGYHSRYSEMKSDVYVKQRYLYLAVISFN
jgi:hypothetical protein